MVKRKMTTEHRIIFEAADVRSIVFECTSCGGSISVAGGRDLHHGEEIVCCPSCGNRWLADHNGAIKYRKFLAMWKDLIVAQEDEKAFTLRFELDATTP